MLFDNFHTRFQTISDTAINTDDGGLQLGITL
jgi:hypothetical protein